MEIRFEETENYQLNKKAIQALNTKGLKLKGEEYIGEFLSKDFTSKTPFIFNGEIIGYPFNLETFIHRFEKYFIPNCLGIYHLFNDDKLVYIGMSKNIRKRLIEHLRDDAKVFNNVLWFCANHLKEDCTIQDIIEIERNMIKYHNPILNIQHSKLI